MDEKKLEYVTGLVKDASSELGVELLSVVESPLPGGYYVVTFWWKREPYSAIVFYWSGDDYRRWSIDSIKGSMLSAMTRISEEVHELLTYIRVNRTAASREDRAKQEV